MKAIYALALSLSFIPMATHAEGLRAVSPLQGYSCMMLRLSNEQIRSNAVTVPVYNGPSSATGEAGIASAVLIVKAPLHIQNGFAEVFVSRRAHSLDQVGLAPAIQECK